MKHLSSFASSALLLWIMPFFSAAQIEQEFEKNFNAAFERFKQKKTDEFQTFRDETNRKFAEFLKDSWEKFSPEQPQERPVRPEPEKPPIAEPATEKPEPQELAIGETVPPLPKPSDAPAGMPGINPVIPSRDTTGKTTVSFYGRSYGITPLSDAPFMLDGLNEAEIAAAWSEVAALPYGNLLNECTGIRNVLRLNDWGYFLLCGEVARKLSGKHRDNETAFLQAFLLCQSGYDVKIARSEDGLLLLAPSSVMLYGYSFLTMDSQKYFILNKKTTGSTAIYTYRQNFSPASKPLDMHITAVPRLSDETTVSEKRIGKEENKASVPVNRVLMDFYRDYPQCDFSVYMHAPVDSCTAEALLTPLRQHIEGKPETEAANLLLGFVQKSFEYKTDPEQFGYEKPFFVEETLFYPYCDCEDRAILYAYLVRTLLKLDVVLLNYPNHIATAVCFTEPVTGDYVRIGDRTYTVCDPTYIDASAGEAMPQCKTASAQVIAYREK